MFGSNPPRLKAELVDNITVVQVLEREIRNPEQAEDLGRDLVPFVGPSPVLINMAKTKYMSSTGFAVLLSFAKKMQQAGGVVRICAMTTDVRRGADIISMGRTVDLFDDEASALASFTS